MLNRRAGLGRGLMTLATVLSLTVGSLLAFAAPVPAGAQSEGFSTASAVPANALLYSVLDLDMESAQWQQFETLLDRLGVPDALDEARTSMLEDSEDEITEEQLDAVLGGEAAFFLLPEGAQLLSEQFEALNENLGEMAMASPEAIDEEAIEEQFADVEVAGLGVILEPSDITIAWELISTEITESTESEDAQVETTTEGDVEIITVTPSSEGEAEVVIANVGDLIVFAGNIIDVQTVVDTANGDADSLADVPAFSQVAAGLPAASISYTYFDGSEIADLVGTEFLEGFYSLSPELAAQAETPYIGGVAFWVDDLGFRVDSISIPVEGGDLSAMVPEGTVTFADRVPADTTLFFGGVVPDGTWNAAAFSVAQGINAGMSGEEPEFQSMDEMLSADYIQDQITQASEFLGFNLVDEFFGQFQGETAFALTFPNLMAMGASFDVNTVFVTELDDASAVAPSVEKLVRLMSSMAGDEFPVTTTAVGDDTLYVIGDPTTTGIPAIQFGVVEDYLVLGSESGVSGFLDGVESPLSDDEGYQETLAVLGGENHYQVAYIDLTDIIPAAMAMSGMAGGMGASTVSDADPACLEFSTQDEAQAAFDEDQFANSNLDQDFDGEACEDLFAPATPTVTAPTGSIEALSAFAAVGYESDGNLYSSAILTVAETEE